MLRGSGQTPVTGPRPANLRAPLSEQIRGRRHGLCWTRVRSPPCLPHRPLPRGAQQTRPHPRGPSRTVARDPVETPARPLLSASPPPTPSFPQEAPPFRCPPACLAWYLRPPPPPRAGLRGLSAPTSVSADSPSRGGPPSAAWAPRPPPQPPAALTVRHHPPARTYTPRGGGLGCLVHWKYPST